MRTNEEPGMGDTEPHGDDAKSGRGPAVQSGASDLGLFAPTPLALGAAGGVLALGATNASATGIASSDAGSTSGATANGAEPSFELSAPAQGSPTGIVLPDIPTASGLLSVARPVSDDGVISAPAVADAPTVPLATTSSATVPVSADAPVGSGASPGTEVVASSGVVASPQIIETIAAIRATADQLNEQLNGALDALVGRAEANLGDAATVATEAIGELGSQVEAITGRIGEASELLDDAVGEVSQTIVGLSGTTDALLGTAQASLDDLTSAASAQLNDVTDALSDTVESTLDLTDLGGSNPAGGIATLTALLSSADGFELGDPASPEPVFASMGDAVSVLEGVGDTVTDLAIPDVPGLLGNHGSLIGGLFDDDGDGHG